MKTNNCAGPVNTSNRYVVLDALRGFALMGIVLANFPEFSLWTFLSTSQQNIFSTAEIDTTLCWWMSFLIDGKFYTIFSILFGIGFSIILERAMQKGTNGLKIFYRRMFVLLLFGVMHMMLLWSGDILLLYAVIGMLLPLFRKMKTRSLLYCALFFLILPIGVETWRMLSGLNPADWLYDKWWEVAFNQGITEEEFSTWLRDVKKYACVNAFLIQGAVERMWEFVEGHRYFKVLGLFLIGYAIGKERIVQNLNQHKKMLKKIFVVTIMIGLPISVVYAWSCTNYHEWGGLVHNILYTYSVYPLGFAYISGFCLMYLKWNNSSVWRYLSYPGRMALSCYISQSVIGMCLFYGIGFGLGAKIGLCYTLLIATFVFVLQIVVSSLWLRYYRFGPLEWLWRMLTYGKYFRIKLD